MESSNDVALYSGLGAGIIAVAILVVAVMLYRKNHSEYGVDVIDSSALSGGFQSFNFKTTRQGKRVTSACVVVTGTLDKTKLTLRKKCGETKSWPYTGKET